MKNALIFILFGLIGSAAVAQTQNTLAGTAWQGQAKVPDEMTIILHFKSDSVFMHIVPDMYLGETMVYTMKGDTLTWRKTGGNSPCDTQMIGTSKIVIKGNEMTLKPINDQCPERRAAWVDKPFRKVAVPTK